MPCEALDRSKDSRHVDHNTQVAINIQFDAISASTDENHIISIEHYYGMFAPIDPSLCLRFVN